MRYRLAGHLQELQSFNLQIRQQLELAEAIIPPINELLKHLAALGLCGPQMISGPVLYEAPYPFGSPSSDSGLVYQAALSLPGGFGVLRCDLEEYLASVMSQSDGSLNAGTFVPFAECALGQKALLTPQVSGLLERLAIQAPCSLRAIRLGSLPSDR
jgi:hypothetical protein